MLVLVLVLVLVAVKFETRSSIRLRRTETNSNLQRIRLRQGYGGTGRNEQNGKPSRIFFLKHSVIVSKFEIQDRIYSFVLGRPKLLSTAMPTCLLPFSTGLMERYDNR